MSKREAYLCVGGPCDGELRVVDGTFFVMRQLHGFASDRNLEVSHTLYDLHSIAGEEEVFHVWTPNGTTGDDLLRQLLKGYAERNRDDHSRADHRHAGVGQPGRSNEGARLHGRGHDA